MYQVFRVEHKTTRKGPFQTVDPFTQELAAMAGLDPRLRFPGYDGLPLGEVPFCFVFGCLDLASICNWFLLGDSVDENRRIVERLVSLDFHLGEYLVEEEDCWISTSGIQVAFNAGRCRAEGLVSFHSLSLLLTAEASQALPVE